MPMPRPRKKPEKKTSWGVHVVTTLLGGVVSLVLIWGGYQILMQIMHQTGSNLQMGTAKSMIAPNATQWKVKSSVEHKAGFTCDDKDNPCPSLLNEYTTDKPVTVKQLEALVPGTNKVTGDCQHANGSKILCETTAKSGIFEYHSHVEKAGKGYLIVISAHPPK